MKYKTFKNSGLSVSCLASGTWAMGGRGYGEIDHQEAIDAIRKMVELGVNLIDTAPCYGWGASEKLVGEAIQTLDRSKIILSTKCGLINTPYQDPIMGRDSSFKNIIREVDSSYRRIQFQHRANRRGNAVWPDRCAAATVFHGESESDRADGMGICTWY